MDEEANQQQLLPNNSPTAIHEAATAEETPLIDVQANEDEAVQSAILEILDWNTSMISEVSMSVDEEWICQKLTLLRLKICRDGDIPRLQLFIEYSQQTRSCAQHAAEIADRLDVDTGLSPLHHAARYQDLEICLILLSHIQFE